MVPTSKTIGAQAQPAPPPTAALDVHDLRMRYGTKGQVFPFYWLGLGARAAMLPEDLAAAEIGGSWRTLEMFVVLGGWAVIGMVLAPIVLRRMARRQSGSSVAEARERIMAKGY